MSRLENWYQWGDRIVGELYNDPRCRDGETVTTSPIVTLDRKGKKLQTKNTAYELGEEFDVRLHDERTK